MTLSKSEQNARAYRSVKIDDVIWNYRMTKVGRGGKQHVLAQAENGLYWINIEGVGWCRVTPATLQTDRARGEMPLDDEGLPSGSRLNDRRSDSHSAFQTKKGF